MIRIAKLELYIISATFIIGLFVIGLFWVSNQGETPTYTPKPVDSEAAALRIDPNIIRQDTVTYQGLAKLIQPTTVKALVLGDAVAESQGASNQELSSWHILITKDLSAKYPGDLQWTFQTTRDATIKDVLTYIPGVTQDIDVLLLCVGRNDWNTVKLTEFKQNYEQLLVELNAKNPQTDVFLIIEPPVEDVAANNRFFPFRKIIMDLGQKHQLSVIDGWSAFINDPTPLAELLADESNPNDTGYEVFADAVLKGFEESLLDIRYAKSRPL